MIRTRRQLCRTDFQLWEILNQTHMPLKRWSLKFLSLRLDETKGQSFKQSSRNLLSRTVNIFRLFLSM